MKRKLVLSIAISSLAGLSVLPLAYADTPTNSQSPTAVNIKPQSGGKCASGKCGTEKIYAQAKLDHNPQNKLIHARDGKCGVSGEGLKTEDPVKEAINKCANGVCGQ